MKGQRSVPAGDKTILDMIPVDLVAGSLIAITAQALRVSERRLDLALAAARLGSWHLDLDTEELTFDPEGRMPARQCVNFGVPTRAWEFTSLAN